VDHPLHDNQVLNIGDVEMRVYHMPGHTPCSTLCVFRHGDQTIGFCGDIVFKPQPGATGAIGRLSRLYLSNLVHYQESLTRFLDIDLDVLLPGHGHPLIGQSEIKEALTHSLEKIKRLRRNRDIRHFGVPR
jgi:glyoxylase-like metal-dependent hydrolase (beta-lactamase superfamily II)